MNSSVLRSQSTMRIISCQSTLVAVAVITLTVMSCSEAKTTQKPKYQYTKKPVSPITVHNPVTTTTPKTLKVVASANPVQPHPLPPTERTTYPSHIFPQYYPENTEAPGVGPDNYTLDYNECYFNFCECCPPERGPRGPKGDRGLTGTLLAGKVNIGSVVNDIYLFLLVLFMFMYLLFWFLM